LQTSIRHSKQYLNSRCRRCRAVFREKLHAEGSPGKQDVCRKERDVRDGPIMALAIAVVVFQAFAACGEEGDRSADETPGGQVMEQYMSIKFLKSQFPAGSRLSKEKLIPAISVVEDAMKAKKPTLVFFVVASNSDPKDEVNKNGTTHTKSMRAKVFSGKQVSWKVGLLAKFALCVEVDITKVTGKDSYYFNSEKGPAVLVVGPNGKQEVLIEAERARPEDVASALAKALDKSDIDSKAILSRLDKEVKALATAEAGALKLEKEQLVMLGQIAHTPDPKAKAALEKQRQAKAAEAVKLKVEIERLQKKIEELPPPRPAK